MGLWERCAGIRMLDTPFQAISEVGTEKEDVLVELAQRAIVEDEADVLIFAGAPLSGLAERVADRIPVPVVDQVVAAVKQAEALVALRLRKATAGTFRRPAAKPTIGLAERARRPARASRQLSGAWPAMRKSQFVFDRTAEGKQAGFAPRRCNDLDAERQLVLRSGRRQGQDRETDQRHDEGDGEIVDRRLQRRAIDRGDVADLIRPGQNGRRRRDQEIRAR